MASLLAADGEELAALALLGYPLHSAGKPEKLRTDHFPDIGVPTMFLQGTRDALCGPELLEPALPTVKGGAHLSHLVSFLASRGITSTEQLMPRALRAWLGHLDERNLARSTIQGGLSAARSFLKGQVDRCLLEANPALGLRQRHSARHLPGTLSKEEGESLVIAPDITRPWAATIEPSSKSCTPEGPGPPNLWASIAPVSTSLAASHESWARDD